MLIHPEDLEEQMRGGQMVTTILDAVPLVIEASSHPCGVCVTLRIGVGIKSGGEGFGLIVTRVDAHLEDLCAQLGYAVSDLTWHTSQITASEMGMAPLRPTERAQQHCIHAPRLAFRARSRMKGRPSMGRTPGFTEVGKSTTVVDCEQDIPYGARWTRWRDQPLAFYRRMHEEHGPLWFDGVCWIVTDEAMIRHIITDEAHFSAHPPARTNPPSPLMHLVMQQALFYDGEEHRRVSRRMRAALASLLRPGGWLLPFLSSTVDRVLSDILPRGHMDVVSDFAAPLTDKVMAAALGLPTSDPDTMRTLMAGADAFADISSGYRREDTDAIFTLREALRQVLLDKRARREEDLLSMLVAAEGAFHEEQAWRSEDELIVTAMMLLAAGRVTARKVITDGVHLLLQADPCWRQLSAAVQAKPSAINTLVEHLLCRVTPTSSIARWATGDVEIGGQHILAGQKLILLLKAANQLSVCPHQPDTLSASELMQPLPRPHFAFGPPGDAHFCVGAALARVELRAVFAGLLHALPDLRLFEPGATLPVHPNRNIGGLLTLPVCWNKGERT